MHIHGSYLHRMTALYAIQVLTESLDVEMLSKVGTFKPHGVYCAARRLLCHAAFIVLARVDMRVPHPHCCSLRGVSGWIDSRSLPSRASPQDPL